MKIVIAPDKFKGSLTGLEFCNAVEEGIQSVIKDVEIVKMPLSDGGDGTIKVANHYLKGAFIKVQVKNPLFNKIEAQYLYSKSTKVAFIEMAEASGIKLLKQEELDCKNTTTYGTGQLILDAINKGAKLIIIGLGGSATNDCGIGMATALGYRFLDKNKKEVYPVGKELLKIVSIDTSNVSTALKKVKFKIACDVTNPLYGKSGAAYVYAQQKGASAEDIKLLDKGLKHFSIVLNDHFNVNPTDIIGAGAAGGMGIATKLFLDGTLVSGITLVKEIAQFKKEIIDADWIITGEGKLDSQTFSGKTISGILTEVQHQKIRVAAFCGIIDVSIKDLNKMGVTYTDSVINYADNLEDALKHSYRYVKEISSIFAKSQLKKVTMS